MYLKIKKKLEEKPATWLVTGVAGFIGSNLLEVLLELNQRVIGIDNFSTGHEKLVPSGVPLFRGSVGDSALIAKICKSCSCVSIMIDPITNNSIICATRSSSKMICLYSSR